MKILFIQTVGDILHGGWPAHEQNRIHNMATAAKETELLPKDAGGEISPRPQQ